MATAGRLGLNGMAGYPRSTPAPYVDAKGRKQAATQFEFSYGILKFSRGGILLEANLRSVGAKAGPNTPFKKDLLATGVTVPPAVVKQLLDTVPGSSTFLGFEGRGQVGTYYFKSNTTGETSASSELLDSLRTLHTPGLPIKELTDFAEGAAGLVTALSARAAEGLRFSLCVANDSRDFQRADNVVVDLAAKDEPALLKLVADYFRAAPAKLLPTAAPLQTAAVQPGLARADSGGRDDFADGFVRRRADHLAALVLEALTAGEETAAQWAARL